MPKGVGGYLTDMIQEFTGSEPGGCKCKEWAKKMDDWGPAGCREHIGEIVGHLVSEAKARRKLWKVAPLGKRWRVVIPVPSALISAPGSEMFLVPFVRHLVFRAIALAEQE